MVALRSKTWHDVAQGSSSPLTACSRKLLIGARAQPSRTRRGHRRTTKLERTLVAAALPNKAPLIRGRAGRAVENVCRRDRCDFAITTGDNIYPAGVRSAMDAAFEEKFEAPYRRLGEIDIWMVMGNHDWKEYLLTGARAQVERTRLSPRWRMPFIHYAIPTLPSWLHIYGLDTSALEGGIGVFQLPAASQALCDQTGWRFVFGHYPTWSNGADGNGGNRFVRWAIEGMIQRCKVHMYFAGHDHHQEHLRLNGYEGVIQGAAGGRLSPVHQRRTNQRFAASTAGFGWVRVTPDSLTIRFFDANAKLQHEWVTTLSERDSANVNTP